MDPNIYPAVVFHLHPKVREFLDGLDQAGQIDRDESNAPHVFSVDPVDQSIFRCVFSRNGKPENFVIHTRRKAEAIRSWRDNDGWKRAERVEVIRPGEPSRKERDRRAINAFEHIMEQILPRKSR